MATSIERVRRAVAQTPWAILPEKLEMICEFLALRAEGHLSDEEIRAATAIRREPRRTRAGGVAVLPVYGTISHRMDMLSAISGGTSTESLGKAFDQFMNDPDIGTIVLDVDSPGGTVTGVQEVAQKIYDARGKGKRIIAVANGMAASAAYWIASAADELVVIPSGVVGSVGVYTIHQDASRMLENEGVKTTIIRAGKHKAEGSPYEPLSEDTRAYAQSQVDEIYDEFVQAVAKHRGVTVAKVESGFGQGRVVKAKAAIAAGMADRIATLDEVLEELGVSRMSRRDEARIEAVEAPTASATYEGSPLTLHATATTHEAGFAAPVLYRNNVIATDSGTETMQEAGRDASGAQVTPPDTEPAPEAREQAMPKENDVAAQNGAAQGGTASAEPRIAVGVDLAAERKRAQAISELCSMHGIGEKASDYIQSGATVEQVVADIRETAASNLQAMKASQMSEMSAAERRRYSLSRAILAAANDDWSDAGFEREISEHIRKNMPKDYKSRGGFFYPVRAALEVGTSTAGGNAVFTQGGDFIDLLRARMKVAELGATILTGLEGGTIAFPKQTGASSWTWVDENPGSDVADTDATIGQVLLAPKAGQTSTAFSRQLLQQASIDVEMFVRNDLTQVAALGIDAAAIAGTGTGNQPTGIIYTSGIGVVPGGTNGAAPDYEDMVDLETQIAVDNADIGSMAYLTTPGIRGKLKKTQQFSSTNGVPVWTGGRVGEVNGYPAHVSTQVPSDLSKGSASGVCHAIVFGVWSQLLIGYWGALELVVDPYTKKKQALIEVTSYQSVGIAVRHAEAFSAMLDALTS
ncbi:MAG TPA: phage major capsid protein [Longimicrobiaceae bacterium]